MGPGPGRRIGEGTTLAKEVTAEQPAIRPLTVFHGRPSSLWGGWVNAFHSQPTRFFFVRNSELHPGRYNVQNLRRRCSWRKSLGRFRRRELSAFLASGAGPFTVRGPISATGAGRFSLERAPKTADFLSSGCLPQRPRRAPPSQMERTAKKARRMGRVGAMSIFCTNQFSGLRNTWRRAGEPVNC